MRTRSSIPTALLALFAVALGTACAGSRPAPIRDSELRELVRRQGIKPDAVVVPTRLTEEMKAWLATKVRPTDKTFDRLRRLLEALQDPNQLDLEYEPGYTGTAEEVFATRKFNCLSFSHLFVAMAREIGIDAYYLRVDRIQRYEKEGDLVVVSGHITAGYGNGPDRQILEFDVGPEVNYRSAVPLTDLQALAMYYSNRGAELMREGDNEEAERWVETAVTLDPDYADGWVNLGVARRRIGNLNGAERAYQTAVELDPGNVSAYHNLATLMRLRGDPHAARQILRLLDRRGTRDPFIFLALGDDSLAEGRLYDAERYYRRALRLSRRHPEVRAAMGLWALAAGDLEQARSWLDQARKLDAENDRVISLAARLADTADGI